MVFIIRISLEFIFTGLMWLTLFMICDVTDTCHRFPYEIWTIFEGGLWDEIYKLCMQKKKQPIVSLVQTK